MSAGVDVLVGQADHLDVLAHRIERGQFRHFLQARRAPGRPEIHHHPLAAMRGQVVLPAVDGGELAASAPPASACGRGVRRRLRRCVRLRGRWRLDGGASSSAPVCGVGAARRTPRAAARSQRSAQQLRADRASCHASFLVLVDGGDAPLQQFAQRHAQFVERGDARPRPARRRGTAGALRRSGCAGGRLRRVRRA